MPPASPSCPQLKRLLLVFLAFFLVLLSSACKRNALAKHDYMYVSAPETSLRDRVATMYNKVGTVHNGDRLDVLEKQRRFLKVRTDGGQEGWIEERSLVSQETFDGFQKLATDNANLQVQAHGTTRAELNMHLTPSREGEHLYQLKDGEKVEIMKRATAEKNPPKPPSAAPPKTSTIKPSKAKGPAASNETSKQQPSAPTPPVPPAKTASPAPVSGAAKDKRQEPPKPVMEDWYLVRNSAGRVGWVLLRMVDLDIPLDVAQYAEGQRIMGYFVLNTVQDGDKQVAQYLVLLNEPKDGLPWDYNQIRIFTWNRARHRYETAYRERNLEGYFPVKTGHQDFGKEGDLPTFTIRKKNDDGSMQDMTYKLNGPLVHKVLTPAEEAAEKAKHDAALQARLAERRKHPSAYPKTPATHSKHKKH